MIQFQCQCGAPLQVSEELVGKRRKCPRCRAVVEVPGMSPPAAPEPGKPAKVASKKICSQCGAAAPSLTYTCEFCGAPLPRTESATSQKLVPKREESVEENHEAPKGVIEQIGSLGNWYTDLVKNDPGTRLREEVRNLPDSPEELITFFSNHIGGVTDIAFGRLHRQACEGVLTKLRVFSTRDPKISKIVCDLQGQLDGNPSPNPVKYLGVVIFCCLIFVMIIFVISGVVILRNNSSDRNIQADIEKMLGEKKYFEARIRAQNLSDKQKVEQTLEAIDKAESTTKIGLKSKTR